jgi:hypothetical protein
MAHRAQTNDSEKDQALATAGSFSKALVISLRQIPTLMVVSIAA